MESRKYNRRDFFKLSFIGLFVTPFLLQCKQKTKQWLVSLSGTNHILGHRLWSKNFPKISNEKYIKYVIVGGGISGLSAARQFIKKGITDFVLLEMESHIGGNSSSGKNSYSQYPRGAHYLPLPNIENKELLTFLQEENIIIGYDNNFPIFDEEQLCFAPHERLFIKNTWQEGLIPKKGVSKETENEIQRFFNEMESLKLSKGNDGKYHFNIPFSFVSKDTRYQYLDKITMKNWLFQNNFKSEELFWYVDYCCKDDFGLGIDNISAWVGIHYFASRKNNSTPEYNDSVLTWPEGNARLANLLRKHSDKNIQTNQIVYEIKILDEKVHIKTYNSQTQSSTLIQAEKIILATPQFINKYILNNRTSLIKNFQYAPWLVASLIVDSPLYDKDFPLSWDNVIYKGKGLGYIYNQNQSINQTNSKKVLSYYVCLTGNDLNKERKNLYRKSKEYWKNQIIEDLKKAHPDIEKHIESLEIYRLGHGMISPVPGFIFSKEKKKASQPIENKIFFAHTDLIGYSLFEEAFQQGIDAVNSILR